MRYLAVLFALSFLGACGSTALLPKVSVQATVETDPVSLEGDAADDPAIYIHPFEREKSVVIGTNKKQGLSVYDLNGRELHHYDFGLLNNVDLRSGFPLRGEKITLVAASNRSDNSLSLYRYFPDTQTLADIAFRKLFSRVKEVYGCCMYRTPEGMYYVFVVGKDGVVEQWELSEANGAVDGEIVRTFDAGGQCEGMAVDDELGWLYIAEEDKGLYKYPAAADAEPEQTTIDVVRKNANLKSDLEGVTIYYADKGRGYLIVSSQGNNTYAVYERNGGNKYIGSFEITDAGVDGAGETDGIDVINLSAGPSFPNGFFIAQDGFNQENGTLGRQNFKLVPWELIANRFDPPLEVDPTYSPLNDN